MRTVFKYAIKPGVGVEAPPGTVTLFGHDPSGQLSFWVFHDTDLPPKWDYHGDEPAPSNVEYFIAGTGQPLADDTHVITSCVDGDFVWHLCRKGFV